MTDLEVNSGARVSGLICDAYSMEMSPSLTCWSASFCFLNHVGEDARRPPATSMTMPSRQCRVAQPLIVLVIAGQLQRPGHAGRHETPSASAPASAPAWAPGADRGPSDSSLHAIQGGFGLIFGAGEHGDGGIVADDFFVVFEHSARNAAPDLRKSLEPVQFAGGHGPMGRVRRGGHDFLELGHAERMRVDQAGDLRADQRLNLSRKTAGADPGNGGVLSTRGPSPTALARIVAATMPKDLAVHAICFAGVSERRAADPYRPRSARPR
jgi:hypothetical protein